MSVQYNHTCFFTGLPLTRATWKPSGRPIHRIRRYSREHLVARKSPLYPLLRRDVKHNVVVCSQWVNQLVSHWPVVLKMKLRAELLNADLPPKPGSAADVVREKIVELRHRHDFTGDGSEADIGWWLWDLYVIERDYSDLILLSRPRTRAFTYCYLGSKKLLHESA